MVPTILAFPDQSGKIVAPVETPHRHAALRVPVVTTEAIIGRGKLSVQKRGSKRITGADFCSPPLVAQPICHSLILRPRQGLPHCARYLAR